MQSFNHFDELASKVQNVLWQGDSYFSNIYSQKASLCRLSSTHLDYERQKDLEMIE